MINPRPKPTRSQRQRVKVKAVKPKKEKKLDPDYFFSLCVRERAGWKCEKCGKGYTPWTGANGYPANPGLHCSHYIGRGNYATRFDPLNVDAHCYFCHSQFEGNPHEFRLWKLERVGQEVYDIIIEKSRNILLGKQARKEKQHIAEHYKQQYHLMKSGVVKDFQGYF